ncbi:MAG TPA: acyl-CoA dehydrogenase family protein [Streptosporangiaceae bacterium]|nr:acyl-CoA dehydrogenase family protein [Streptosporangiaceae bacterium]
MDFALTEAQQELAALTRQILAGRAGPAGPGAGADGGQLDAGGLDAGLWASLAQAGILAAALPDSLGGAGAGLLEQCSVLAELGRAVAAAPYLTAIVLGAGAIARFGTPEQCRRWAGPAGRGELVPAVALEEEDSDDLAVPAARAEPAGSGWVLSGVKTAVIAGAGAGLLLVPASVAARQDGSGGPAGAGRDGAAVFLIEPGDAGVSVEPQQLTGASAARVVLDRAELAADRVLGSPAAGPQVLAWLTGRGTAGLCALQLGVLERALELTAQYARERQQFGRPIGSFQAVAQRLADAYIDVEAVRLTMWQAAWRLEAGLDAGAEVAMAKFWAAEAGHRVAHTAVHVHGGTGVDLSGPVQRYFLAAKHHEFALGGATAQLRRLGDLLAAGG